MIEVRNLVKRYGTHLAVDHLSFTVEKGQIYGFLGPNGAGKSTTMNIMTGYLGATEGEVLINGHNILEEPELAKQCIGYLPEMPPLYMEMRVREYLDFAAELKKIPKKERKDAVDRAVEMAKLVDVEDRLIKNLSKGYKQRVGLAQAILGFPEIIILDEPTVGLDPKQIIEIRELIRELAKEHTVILSSHILAEIQEVCDYILIISGGKLVASDTPDNLEKMLQGQQSVEILAKGTEEQVRTILKTIDGINATDIQNGDEEGTIKVSMIPVKGEDIRERVFRAFAVSDCPLLLLSHSRTTLEDVFLELTDGEEESVDEGDL
ncbi:MAG: ABC transporter ATP-binding protein [Bariatricus sp.]|nr:ABC transporter ATP-binding protein [Bariatricus sp.]